MSSTLGFRIAIFVAMTLTYIVFLIALAERFALAPPSPTASDTAKANEVSLVSQADKSPFPSLSETAITQSHPDIAIPFDYSADAIEICTDSPEDCYTFYPGIKPRRSMAAPGTVATKSGDVIRNVSAWAWSVLSRGVRARGQPSFPSPMSRRRV